MQQERTLREQSRAGKAHAVGRGVGGDSIPAESLSGADGQ